MLLFRVKNCLTYSFFITSVHFYTEVPIPVVICISLQNPCLVFNVLSSCTNTYTVSGHVLKPSEKKLPYYHTLDKRIFWFCSEKWEWGLNYVDMALVILLSVHVVNLCFSLVAFCSQIPIFCLLGNIHRVPTEACWQRPIIWENNFRNLIWSPCTCT